MRFSRLDLLKYGHFDGCSLEFVERPVDLHIIFGQNEAGKSTAMSAICDLLFQFPNSTPFDFRHDKQLLRVGATVMRDGSTVTCRRKKGRSNTLLDSADRPMDEGVLAALLGGQTRESFLRMFSLDHGRLRDGGRAILEAKDDIGQAIFAAGSGLIGITDLQQTLDQEAKDTWGKRAGSQSYHSALKDYEYARTVQRNALVKPGTWTQLRDQVAEAKTRLAGTKTSRKVIEAGRWNVERTRRTLVPIAALQAAREELQSLGEVVELPSDARLNLSEAVQEIANAEAQRSKAMERKRRYEGEIEGIVVEATLVSQRAEIDILRESRGAVEKSLTDLPRRRGELQNAVVQLSQLQTELGWPIEEASQAQEQLPKQVAVAEVRALLEERTALDAVMFNAVEREEAAQSELTRARGELEALSDEVDMTGLMASLAVAQAAGDLDASVAAAEGVVQRENSNLDKSLKQLAPWDGEADDLEGLFLPSEAWVGEAAAKLRRFREEAEREAYDLRRSEERLAQIELQKRQVSNEGGAISPEQVSEVRASRDFTLESIRERVLAGTFCAGDAHDVEVLSDQIHDVDDVTDRRFAGATQSSRLAAKTQELEQASLELEQHRAGVQGVTAVEATVRQEWRESLTGLGFYLLPDDLVAWRIKRDTTLEAIGRLREAESQVALLKAKRLEISALVSGEIDRIKPELGLNERSQYGHLLQAGSLLRLAAETTGKERLRLSTFVFSAWAVVNQASTSKEKAQEGLNAWIGKWVPAVERVGLLSDSSNAVIRTQLEFVEQLRTRINDVMSLEHRIAGMQDDVTRFKETLHALARTCNIAPEDASDTDVMQELTRRSAEAATLSERKEGLKRQVADAIGKIEACDVRIGLAEARIDPLLAIAHVDSHDALRIQIGRSERAQQLATAIGDRERELTALGEGLSVELLIEESCGADATSLKTKSGELKDESDRISEKIEQESGNLATLEVAFNAIDDGPDAVLAAADAELARAKMTEEAERYLQKRCQALLLSWAVERYRAEKQAPLLKRASALFATLTLNRFSRLLVSSEDDEARLSGMTSSGDVVSVNGMSEGTVDQLFLALRVAAVEDEVAQGIRLPFLADDLFVNYDDQRAAAGFQVLSELAGHTQVLFFTHHKHLVDVAKNAVAPESISECMLHG